MDHNPLSVESVTYQYAASEWRLFPSSFSVMKGEILGIIGPNGSGKSTLLKLAARILSPGAGTVLLDGRDLTGMGRREIARHLAYLPQNTESHLDYTVEEVVAMGRFAHARGMGFLGPDDIDVVTRSLFQTETEGFRQRSLSRLSGGERQRVFLASVIAQEPKVLLLDEPTSALDIHHQVRFFNLLTDLVAEGMAVAVVMHDLNLACLFGDRLLLLKQGKIVHQGSPEEILNKQILHEIYGDGVEIVEHPATGRPVVLPTTAPVQHKKGTS